MDRPFFQAPNQYSRAFAWRVSTSSEESKKTSLGGMSLLSRSDFPEILEDFLDVSRKRRKNKTAISKLQLYMLQEIVFQEAVIKRCKQRLRELESLSTGQADTLAEIEHVKREIFMFRVYGNAIRSIGDGIAWRALDYDRAVTHLLAEHATKQQIMSEGLLGELLEWSIRFDTSNNITVLNSLTNCLAIGDVTVVNDDASVEIIEVKSSNTKSRRKVRQKQKMREVVTLLSSGQGEAGDKQVSIEIVPIEPESGLGRVGALLSEAETRGWASEAISNCLYVECFDFDKIQQYEAIRHEVEAKRKEIVGEWEQRDNFVLEQSSLNVIAFSPNCAPFSIFPFSNRVCTDLLIGRKCYIAYLNFDAVAREFEFHGWTVIKTPMELMREGNTNASLVVRKQGLEAGIPPADFMRMHMEALRVKTAISGLEASFKGGPRGFSLQLYESERVLWD